MAGLAGSEWTGMKVFSVTMAQDRQRLGESVSAWVRKSKVKVVHTEVMQSSDQNFHCVSIIVFYTGEPLGT